MRQGHRADAIAEHTGGTWAPYMSKPSVSQVGSSTCSVGGRSRRREDPPGSWTQVE